MRRYGQYCALAKSLDVVGDRWSLLIVRELLIRGPSRYTDLKNGLPGIASNLLADRLRELEQAGVLERKEAPPPIASTLFSLTSRGAELVPVLLALGRWGAPMMADDVGDDEYQAHWLALPIQLLADDGSPDDPPATIELHTGDEPLVVEVGGSVRARPGSADDPDLTVTGGPLPVLHLVTGRLSAAEAERRGVKLSGDRKVLRRLRPRVQLTA